MSSGQCSVCVVFGCYELRFFFFKQKTAYEMRISDWSSYVCSSDLAWSLPRARGYPAIPWAWRRSESRYARRLPVGRALSSSAFGLPHVLRSHHGEIPVLGSVDVD